MEQYRFQNGSLYELNGNAYIHCAVVPRKYKTLTAAVNWYENTDQDGNWYETSR